MKTYLFFIILLCNAMLANSQNTPPDGYYECMLGASPLYVKKEAIISCYIPEETLQIPGQTKKRK